jgi:hypothetical protein
VKAAQDAALGEGLVVLHKAIWEASGSEGPGIEYFGEPATLVAILLGAETFYVTQAGVKNLHGSFYRG